MTSVATDQTYPGESHLHALADQHVVPGERWIYSAGFNVKLDLRDTSRIDCELADLSFLANSGARVAILSHQGRRRENNVLELGFVARYLEEQLQRPVGYSNDNVSPAAVDRSHRISPGEIVLFGNTRSHAGEERNDPRLAERFAQLGDRVAVGGFSKAHRAHASNVGLLDYRPGYAADALLDEVQRLRLWSGGRQDGALALACVGGLKREKLALLGRLAERYDVIIPGGAVLSVLLREAGVAIGASDVGECGRCAHVARALLSGRTRAEVVLPDEVVVARPGIGGGWRDARSVLVRHGVPATHAIVDLVLPPRAREWLRLLAAQGGRAILAGTPSCYLDGYTGAADELLDGLAASAIDALLVGGDTVAELPWLGATSTGGGAALEYLATGRLAVLDALAAAGARKARA